MLKRLVAQKRLIGWLAVMAIAGGLAGWLIPAMATIGGSFWRVGVMLAALWLAIPNHLAVDHPPISLWKVAGILAVLLAVVRRPWILVPIGIVMAVLSLFRRRSG